MNLDTGEIIQLDSPEQLDQLELAAKEERLAKLEQTLQDIGAERVLDDDAMATELIETMSNTGVTYKALKRMPKASCRKCYGRGYIGKDLKTNQYVPCSCVL